MSYEAGLYNCVIGAQGFRTSTKNNTVFWFQITPEGGEYQRRVELTITPNTIDFVLDKLSRLGVTGITAWSQLDPETDGYFSLSGQSVQLLNTPKPGQDGKTYDNFDLPPQHEPKEVEPAGKKALKDLDALFGKALKAKFGNNASKPKAKAAPAEKQPDNTITGVGTGMAPDPEEDSSIPF